MFLISFVSLVSLAAAAGDGLTQLDDGTGRRFVMVQIPVSLDGETRCYARLHLAAGELEPPAAAAAAFCAASARATIVRQSPRGRPRATMTAGSVPSSEQGGWVRSFCDSFHRPRCGRA